MKEKIIKLVLQSLNKLIEKQLIDNDSSLNIIVTPTKQKSHGDFATNIALMLSKKSNYNPIELAKLIIENIPNSNIFEKVEIAGPGFINFYLNHNHQFNVIEQIINQSDKFGQGKPKNCKINLEFTSANPTGPLHVGHGRGAAIGSAIASLLAFAGYQVETEYYVNDAGRQMDILAVSVWLRYLELEEYKFTFPSNGYKGDYIYDIARRLKEQFNEEYNHPIDDVLKGIPDDYNPDTNQGNKEDHIDGIIANSKKILKKQYDNIHKFSLNSILADIKTDLSEFGVNYTNWFSEASLAENEEIDNAINTLKDKGLLYKKDGATWFKSTDYGDDKDRVVIRANGQRTYFASDAAYMLNKFQRGFDKIIYLFGTDHHGYIPRMMALAEAFGIDKSKVIIPLIQFAILYENGKQIQMSTRSGSFVTLRQLREDVGTDAARFFYIMRKADQHLDFDLDLAKSKSNENPVYYVQYAHARICSVFRQLSQKNLAYHPQVGIENISELNQDIESDIANKLLQYPDIIQISAEKLEPHLITNYLRELAQLLHMYYNQYKFILDNQPIMQARLVLIDSIREVIKNALNLLHIQAPSTM
ncbi:arginine--tRNA ligase [Thiotrichales bacterium 19S11-10]|nr:arginine--tRNA ligase [Thiotrichales bacterium 19S11-10]